MKTTNSYQEANKAINQLLNIKSTKTVNTMKTAINTPKVTISTIGQYRAKAKNQPAWHPERATVSKIDIYMGYISQRGTNRYDSGISTGAEGVNYIKQVFTHGARRY